ncbi:surface carbohydrate biosynthesis protein [Pseudoalteromonas sp. bablab_jr004]|uniref:surface carbohydrate biosynthesis protein n=1 Tax=Pseudoalteromonas sp. bablab_jr004 TaxID=2755065 RepID=UPI0018F55FA5
MKTFLFPIETTARELDHKILMAAKIAGENNQVIIGDQQYIRILSFFLKGGVFYGKHLFGKPKFSDTTYYKRLKDRKFNIVHLNEEGAVWPGGESVWKNLLLNAERPSVLSKSDYMLTWGEWQKEFNCSYEKVEANIIATGHPRFDLYSQKYRNFFKDDIQKLESEFGKFILVNTSFSYSNNGEGGVKFIFKPTISYNVSSPDDRIYRFNRWRNQMVSMAEIVNLINEIALEFPDKKIILRPHPSECTNYYKEIFQNIDNVHVIYEGPATPWILASDLLIHNGCTTAIEATLAGKRVINFKALNSDEGSDVYLANVCGYTLNTVDAVLDFINNQDNEIHAPKDELANKLFVNFSKNNTSEKVKEILLTSANEVDNSNIAFKPLIFMMSAFVFYVYKYAKKMYLLLTGKKDKYKDYKKRFEVFERDHIDRKFKLMNQILKTRAKVTSLFGHGFVVNNENK